MLSLGNASVPSILGTCSSKILLSPGGWEIDLRKGGEDRGGHLAICQVVTVAASAGVPSPSPRFSILPEGLTTEIYYRERIESKISKGKRPMSQSLEDIL